MKRRDFLTQSIGLAGAIVPALGFAQSKPCSPSMITVSGGGSAPGSCSFGVLQDVAKAMPAGSWVEFDGASHNGVVAPVPANIVACLCHGANSGHCIPYINEAIWNPVGKRIEYITRDHGAKVDFTVNGVTYVDTSAGDGYYMYHYRVSADTAAFSVGTMSPSPGHGYDHTIINPYTGDVYLKHYYNGGTISRLPYGTSAWQVGAIRAPSAMNITFGMCWWDGPWKGTTYPQGLLMIWTCTGNKIDVYDPVGNSWLASVTTPTLDGSGYDYQGVMAYSKVKNCAIFGGNGGSVSNRIVRLNADGTCTQLNNMPGGWGIGYAQTAVEPTTGNFLMNFSDAIYLYNPDGSGSRTAIRATRPGHIPGGNLQQSMICTIDEYGVVAFISAYGGGPAYLHLYKHG